MTDNEIIKALECCSSNGKMDCNNCHLKKTGVGCITTMVDNALALINRQKAEIERLHKKIGEDAQTALEVTLEEIRKAKAEAIKEFAERLKAKGAVHFCKCGQSFVYTDLFNGEIDNLVNEMVGEAK